jgi:hypothetical protein
LIFEAHEPPQLFEVANRIGVSGKRRGQVGDPPIGTGRAFHLLAAPGLEASQEPWPGAFEGPIAHDYPEKPLLDESK